MPSHYHGSRGQQVALDAFIKITRAALTLNHAISRELRGLGLTEPQFAVLEVLYHRGPLRQGLISEKLLFTGGNLTLVLDNLERLSLIERRPNPDDRRCSIVDLTAEGRRIIDDYFPLHAEFIARMMSVLSEAEQVSLAMLSRKLGLAVSADSKLSSE